MSAPEDPLVIVKSFTTSEWPRAWKCVRDGVEWISNLRGAFGLGCFLVLAGSSACMPRPSPSDSSDGRESSGSFSEDTAVNPADQSQSGKSDNFEASGSEAIPVDQDGDGFAGSPMAFDCDDNNSSIYPGADEECDHQDNDCDEAVDEGYYPDKAQAPYRVIQGFVDSDRDDYGTGAVGWVCSGGTGSSKNSGDCDDKNPEVFPGAPETCDDVDNNCDTIEDEGTGAGTGATWCRDYDRDGYGSDDPTQYLTACYPPLDGYDYVQAPNCGDCYDHDPESSPDADEICDDYFGLDEDCDGQPNAEDPSCYPTVSVSFP